MQKYIYDAHNVIDDMLNVKRISDETWVQIQPEEEGVWSFLAPSITAIEETDMMIKELHDGKKAFELVFGAIYTSKITELLDHGVMLSLHATMDSVFASQQPASR